MSIIQFESDVGKSQMKTIAKRLVQSLGYEVHKIRPSSTWRPPDREPREGKVFFPKPERILKTTYPNLTLLESLKASDFTQSNIPEHEFLQFRRLQNLIHGDPHDTGIRSVDAHRAFHWKARPAQRALT